MMKRANWAKNAVVVKRDGKKPSAKPILENSVSIKIGSSEEYHSFSLKGELPLWMHKFESTAVFTANKVTPI